MLQYNDDVIEDNLVDNVKLPTMPLISSFVFIFDTTGATSRAGTAYTSEALEFTPGFSRVRFTPSLVLCACFVDRCLFFFDLPILITPVVFSNSSLKICKLKTV
jgi:hypothetical protein